MSDRISIAGLRHDIDRWSSYEPLLDPDIALALVEAVEAARVVAEDFYACGGDVSATGEEAIDALALLLARFDFGDAT